MEGGVAGCGRRGGSGIPGEALESREGTRASRRVEEGRSRSFSLEGVPGLPGAPQDEAGLTRKFETSHVGPIDGSPPGSPSLGFSRQEHWSGLPFPSPMHESEK